MKVFLQIVAAAQDKMKAIAMFCLMAMCGITCADVLLRATINRPIFGSEEIASICAVIAIGCALPFSHRKKAHVGVEIFMRQFSRRTQAIVKAGTDFLSFGLFGLLSWKMFVYGHALQTSGELSMNLKLPTFLFIYALAGCFLILALSVLNDIVVFFSAGAKKL